MNSQVWQLYYENWLKKSISCGIKQAADGLELEIPWPLNHQLAGVLVKYVILSTAWMPLLLIEKWNI